MPAAATAQSTSIPPATASPTPDQIKPPPPPPPSPPPPPPLQHHIKTINNTTTTTIKQPSTPSPLRLDGKVAIVTGGAGGIGSAIVNLFAKHGAKVIIADINNHTATTLLSTPPLNNYPSLTYIHCDVTNESSVKSLIDKTISVHGKLDILINNAGILTHHHHNNSILNFDPNEFDRIMNVNLKGVALCIKHAARAMINTNTTTSGCNIVSIASVAGIMGGLGPHGYTVSKHGVIGLTKNAGCELGKYGIRVNCVSPFGVATPMLVNAWRGDDQEEDDDDDDGVEKMEEFVRGIANLKSVTLKASDVAEAVLYLVSDEAKYVSGHNLVVDGGFTTCNNIVGL